MRAELAVAATTDGDDSVESDDGQQPAEGGQGRSAEVVGEVVVAPDHERVDGAGPEGAGRHLDRGQRGVQGVGGAEVLGGGRCREEGRCQRAGKDGAVTAPKGEGQVREATLGTSIENVTSTHDLSGRINIVLINEKSHYR